MNRTRVFSIIVLVLLVGVFFIPFPSASGEMAGFKYYFESGDSRSIIANQDKVNDVVNLSGANFVLMLELSNSYSMNDVFFDDVDVDISRIYHNNSGEYLLYIYNVHFLGNGNYTMRVTFVGGFEYIVEIHVYNAEYVWITSAEYDELTANWEYAEDNAEILGDIYGVDYGNTSDGFDAAVDDAIDDVKALRQGPEVFGVNMLMAGMILFINPYTFLWVLIMGAFVVASRRDEMKTLESINRGSRGMDVDDTAKKVASRLAQDRERGLMADTSVVCNYFGVPQLVWKLIVKDYPNVGSLMGDLASVRLDAASKFHESSFVRNFRGWLELSVNMNYSERVDGDLVHVFASAVSSLINFSTTYLNFSDYAKYNEFVPALHRYGQNVVTNFTLREKADDGYISDDISKETPAKQMSVDEMAESISSSLSDKL